LGTHLLINEKLENGEKDSWMDIKRAPILLYDNGYQKRIRK
jgi:hypothetical protein